MTRNFFIFTKLQVPTVYEDEYRQNLYEEEYRRGRSRVDLGQTETICLETSRLQNPACLRGYLDGIRDEKLFQLGELKE